MLHALDPAVDVLELPFDPLDGGASGVGIGVVELLVGFVFKGDHRFWLEQEACHDVHDAHGPEAGEQEEAEDDGPCPEDAQVVVLCNTPADPHEQSPSGFIKSAGGGELVHLMPEPSLEPGGVFPEPPAVMSFVMVSHGIVLNLWFSGVR